MKLTLRSTFFLLGLICISINAIAQDPKSMSEAFCKCVLSNGTHCIDNLYESNPWLNKDADAKNNLKQQLDKLASNTNLLGKLMSFELVETKEMGQVFKGYVYVLKFERQPYRIKMIFYNSGGDKWMLFKLHVDENIDIDFENELSK